MARARVELKGAQTHSHANKTMRKGVAEIMVDEELIAYYKSQSMFVVTEIQDPKPLPKAPPPQTAPVKAKQKAKQAEEDEEDDEPPI